MWEARSAPLVSAGICDIRNINEWKCNRGCDLPLNIHPAAIRVSAVDTPFGAV